MRFLTAMAFLCCLSSILIAENLGGGRGGPFLEYHARSLSVFDTSVSGTPAVIGGVGFGWATRSFRLGGGGGGGFLWNGSDNVEFGMGYGGLVGEYAIAPWLTGRLMIGGGGYSVSKVTSESDSSRTFQKLDSGGFILFHPSLMADIKIHSWCMIAVNLGYFLPNVGKLQSATLGFNLLFGANPK